MGRMTTGAPPRPSAAGSPPPLIQTTTSTARSSVAVAASFLLSNPLGGVLVLAFAAYCQIWAAALSAVAGAVRRFTVSALLYVLSAAVAVGVGAALMATLGIYGAAIGVLLGAGVLLAGHLAYLHRFGFLALP